jgi:hypothetical protein
MVVESCVQLTLQPSDICGADVCVVILLLSSSKAFMLSASKPQQIAEGRGMSH